MTARPEAAKAIEAILMVAQEPVDPHLLAQLLEISQPRVEDLCSQLAASYEAEERAFVLAKVAGGYRFQSHGDLAPYVERFVLEGQSARLSSAALETLAIVAYKQPLSRAQVASIRGVNVDGVMRTLVQRGYIVEVGRDHGPGQATLFGTSREFLERLGLASLDDLPPIADLFPDADVMEALERGLRADPAPAPSPELPLDDASPDDDAAPASDHESDLAAVAELADVPAVEVGPDDASDTPPVADIAPEGDAPAAASDADEHGAPGSIESGAVEPADTDEPAPGSEPADTGEPTPDRPGDEDAP